MSGFAPIATGFAGVPLPSLVASLRALLGWCADAGCSEDQREALATFATAHLVEIAQRVADLVEADPATLSHGDLRAFLTGAGFLRPRPVAAPAPPGRAFGFRRPGKPLPIRIGFVGGKAVAR